MAEPSRSPRTLASLGQPALNGVVLCLFLMRFYFVTESAGQGDTLWIVALWFLAVCLWSFVSFPTRLTRFSLLDLGVALLAGGHILSALTVIATAGDKRAALNLAWEWLGILAAWFLLRQQCLQAEFRRQLLLGVLASGTMIAGLGIYQHYIEFPQTVAKYGPMFDRLKTADAAEAAQIRREMVKEGIPMEGPSQVLFEKRLRDSREPMGLFALANSLGGLLATCLILAVTVAAASGRGDAATSRQRLMLCAVMIGVLGFCLLLTKSRTAWIGTIVGLFVWRLATWQTSFTRRQRQIMVVALVALVGAGWILTRVGGLDRQVLTEAPKSLQYRLQYWAATWSMIKDQVWLGVGPGQFRQSYLFYKLPAASEEIADPHNLVFDVAANGGIASVLGLCTLIIALGRQFRRPLAAAQETNARDPSISPQTVSILSVISAFAAVVWVVMLFTGADDRLLVLIPLAIALSWLLDRVVGVGINDPAVLRVAAVSAAFGLLAHLLGAGGIGMPAISLLVLGLAALSSDISADQTTKASNISPTTAAACAGSSLALVMALFLTGLWPLSILDKRLAAGDQLVTQNFADAADREYTVAASADPFSAEPWRRRAGLAFQRAEAERFRSNELFQNAVRLKREANSRDPANYQDDRQLGDWWLSRWRLTNQTEDAQQAADALQRAWNRYPSNAMLMAELAFALEATGNTHRARTVAARAVKQDLINHEKEHVDRYLPAPILARLEKLMTGAVDGTAEH